MSHLNPFLPTFTHTFFKQINTGSADALACIPSHHLKQCWLKLYFSWVCYSIENVDLIFFAFREIFKTIQFIIKYENDIDIHSGGWFGVNSEMYFETLYLCSLVLIDMYSNKLIKSPQYTWGDYMFLYRFVRRRRRRRRRRRPQILVHAITFEQLLGFLSFLAQLLALTCRWPDYIFVDFRRDLDLDFSRSNMEFAISQPKMVRLPRNEKQT